MKRTSYIFKIVSSLHYIFINPFYFSSLSANAERRSIVFFNFPTITTSIIQMLLTRKYYTNSINSSSSKHCYVNLSSIAIFRKPQSYKKHVNWIKTWLARNRTYNIPNIRTHSISKNRTCNIWIIIIDIISTNRTYDIHK